MSFVEYKDLMMRSKELEEYVQEYARKYKKMYGEDASISSIDTEDLLSDTSKESFKSKKNRRINRARSSKKSVPLKIINEEEEDGKLQINYNLDDYLPGGNFRKHVDNSFSVELNTTYRSVDTELLLNSDEEIQEKNYDLPFRPPNGCEHIEKEQEREILICSCIVKGSLFKHLTDCNSFKIRAKIPKEYTMEEPRKLKNPKEYTMEEPRKLKNHKEYIMEEPRKLKNPEFSAYSEIEQSTQDLLKRLNDLKKVNIEDLTKYKRTTKLTQRLQVDQASECNTEDLLNSSLELSD